MMTKTDSSTTMTAAKASTYVRLPSLETRTCFKPFLKVICNHVGSRKMGLKPLQTYEYSKPLSVF